MNFNSLSRSSFFVAIPNLFARTFVWAGETANHEWHYFYVTMRGAADKAWVATNLRDQTDRELS